MLEYNMYDKNRYNKFKHIAAAVLYAAILLTEACEFFVSTSHEIQVDHNTKAHYGREIPEHIPEKYEINVLKVLKVCKQKISYSKNGTHSAEAVCFVVSILKGSNVGSPSEIDHEFIG